MANENEERQCKRMGNLKDTVSATDAVEEMGCRMGNYVPSNLAHIRQHNPELAVIIKELDRVLVEDGALDRKTKRLIALACVAVRMCEDCIYPQAKVAANYGATKDEIVEAMHVAVVVGGVPSWSIAKKGLTQVFNELEGTAETVSENTPGGTSDSSCQGGRGHGRK